LKKHVTLKRWLWENVLAPGKITLWAAEAKAGKTTLLCLLLRLMLDGGELCGHPVYPAKAIVVSEEPEDNWIEYGQRYGLGDHVEVVPNPFKIKPTPSDWKKAIADVLRDLDDYPEDNKPLVVLDTLSHLWNLLDENDNAKVAEALMPLRQLSEAGAAVLIVHHFGSERSGPRGGTELRAFPDLLLDMYLANPADPTNRRRTLKVRGRLVPTAGVVTVELNEEGTDYEIVEGDLAAGKPSRWQKLQELVPGQPPGFSVADFCQHWPEDEQPDAGNVTNLIKRKWEAAGWQRTGLGGKADPFRWWDPNKPASDGAGQPQT
jgi:hypothetical protein